MPTKKVNLSPQVIEAVSRVISRGETAQVKYNERDGVVKVFGVKMKSERVEEGVFAESDTIIEPTSGVSNLAKEILIGERITAKKYD